MDYRIKIKTIRKAFRKIVELKVEDSNDPVLRFGEMWLKEL
jgi:hypothetical protein